MRLLSLRRPRRGPSLGWRVPESPMVRDREAEASNRSFPAARDAPFSLGGDGLLFGGVGWERAGFRLQLLFDFFRVFHGRQ